MVIGVLEHGVGLKPTNQILRLPSAPKQCGNPVADDPSGGVGAGPLLPELPVVGVGPAVGDARADCPEELGGLGQVGGAENGGRSACGELGGVLAADAANEVQAVILMSRTGWDDGLDG